MACIKSYQLEKDRVFATGQNTYIKGDKVPAGKLLRVTHISGHHEDVKDDEPVELGYWNGHAYVPLTKAYPEDNNLPVHWNGNVWLREEQFVYANLSTVANGEKMKLRAEGRWE